MPAAYLNDYQETFNASSATTIGVNYTRTAASMVFVAVRWETVDAACTISDGASTTYTSIARVKNPGQNFWVQIFYAKNVSSGTNDVTATWDSAVDYRSISIFGFSGLSTSAPYDSYQSGTSSSSGSAALSSSLSVPGAGVTISACGGWNSTSTWTVPGGYTVAGATTPQFLSCAYKLQTGSGAQAATYQSNVGTNYLVHVGAVFVETGGGGSIGLAAGATAGASVSASITVTNQLAIAAVAAALGSGSLNVTRALTGSAIGQALGSATLSAFSNVWRVPTNAPNGTAVHVIILSGSSPTYAVVAQGPATVAGGFADLPATGAPGTKAFGFVHNYNDNTATTSIRGGPSIATLTAI